MIIVHRFKLSHTDILVTPLLLLLLLFGQNVTNTEETMLYFTHNFQMYKAVQTSQQGWNTPCAQ